MVVLTGLRFRFPLLIHVEMGFIHFNPHAIHTCFWGKSLQFSLLLRSKSFSSVDKYKYAKFGIKVGKSVILCQQVVILEIFINQ